MPNVRRQFPKVTGIFSVQVIKDNGDTIDATASEISSNTMLLECNKMTATRIMPNHGESVYIQLIEVATLCNLPLSSGQTLVMKGHGKITSFRRVTEDNYHVCIILSEIDDENYARLSLFLEQCI